jgi:hypothetical protein
MPRALMTKKKKTMIYLTYFYPNGALVTRKVACLTVAKFQLLIYFEFGITFPRVPILFSRFCKIPFHYLYTRNYVIRSYTYLILQATSRNVIIGGWVGAWKYVILAGNLALQMMPIPRAKQAYVMIYRIIVLQRVKLMLALDGSLLKRK